VISGTECLFGEVSFGERGGFPNRMPFGESLFGKEGDFPNGMSFWGGFVREKGWFPGQNAGPEMVGERLGRESGKKNGASLRR